MHPKQFHENKVKEAGPGVLHMVVLTTASTEDSQLPEFDAAVLDVPPVSLEEGKKEEEKEEEEEEKKEPPKVKATNPKPQEPEQ